MEQPTTPFFLFDREKHFIDLYEAMGIGQRVSQLTLVSAWDSHCVVYDSLGVAWAFRFDCAKSKYSWWDKFLAQFYNPAGTSNVTWHRQQNYAFSELQKAFLDALAHDDDILTQFVEEGDLRSRIQRSANFPELLETWRWMQTDHDYVSPVGCLALCITKTEGAPVLPGLGSVWEPETRAQ